MLTRMVLVLALGGAAAEAAQVELGPRYIDPKNGFSLRPPAGAGRLREFPVLVRWNVRDPKTNAVAWTVAVRKEPAPKPGVNVQAFAKQLSAALDRRSDVKVRSVTPGRLLGKDAVYVQTERGGRARRWQTEVWVLADAQRFLALSVNGPLAGKDRLNAAMRDISATLRLIDPATLAAARKENLARGLELLGGVSLGKLQAAVAKEPRWYLCRRVGRDVGFLYVAERIVRRGSASGIEVRTVARLTLRGGQVMVLRRTLFAPADRGSEKWTESAHVYRARKVLRRMSEEGTSSGGRIVCTVSAGGKADKRTKQMPPPTAGHYLPRALAMLLPRLVDLGAARAYAFAGYTTAANDFDLRTFTVVGPETVTLGAQSHEAIRLTDQLAADAEAATLHVQPGGKLLRMRTAGGLTMELSTHSAIRRRYTDADTLVRPR